MCKSPSLIQLAMCIILLLHDGLSALYCREGFCHNGLYPVHTFSRLTQKLRRKYDRIVLLKLLGKGLVEEVLLTQYLSLLPSSIAVIQFERYSYRLY